MKKTLKRYGRAELFVTDGLRSYGAALKAMGRDDDGEVADFAENGR